MYLIQQIKCWKCDFQEHLNIQYRTFLFINKERAAKLLVETVLQHAQDFLKRYITCDNQLRFLDRLKHIFRIECNRDDLINFLYNHMAQCQWGIFFDIVYRKHKNQILSVHGCFSEAG